MKTGEKFAFAFFATMGALSLVAIPFIADGVMSRGIFRGVPLWIMCLISFAVCVSFIVVGVINIRRSRSGRAPL